MSSTFEEAGMALTYNSAAQYRLRRNEDLSYNEFKQCCSIIDQQDQLIFDNDFRMNHRIKYISFTEDKNTLYEKVHRLGKLFGGEFECYSESLAPMNDDRDLTFSVDFVYGFMSMKTDLINEEIFSLVLSLKKTSASLTFSKLPKDVSYNLGINIFNFRIRSSYVDYDLLQFVRNTDFKQLSRKRHDIIIDLDAKTFLFRDKQLAFENIQELLTFFNTVASVYDGQKLLEIIKFSDTLSEATLKLV